MKRRLFLLAYFSAAALLFTIICAMCGVGAAFPYGKKHVYYLLPSSEAAVYTSDTAIPARLLLSEVGGESVTLDYVTREDIEKKYSATLLFSCSAAGVDNYYYYSPDFSSFVYICGVAVNLHIAERADDICVGTPIIFGGY